MHRSNSRPLEENKPRWDSSDMDLLGFELKTMHHANHLKEKRTIVEDDQPISPYMQHLKDHGKALSVPDDLDEITEGLRLRIDIILAKARKTSCNRHGDMKKGKAAVPLQTVKSPPEVALKRLIDGLHQERNSRSVEELAKLILNREDKPDISLDDLYTEFLSRDPEFRATMSTDLIAAIKKLTNREAIMFLIMQVILAEEKTAREKVPLILTVEKKDRELEETHQKSLIEVATLRNRVNALMDQAKQKEETFDKAIAALGKENQLNKAEKSRLQEALTLAVMTYKEEVGKVELERDNYLKELKMLRSEISTTDLKYIELNNKKIKTLETSLQMEKQKSSMLVDKLQEDNNRLHLRLVDAQKLISTLSIELELSKNKSENEREETKENHGDPIVEDVLNANPESACLEGRLVSLEKEYSVHRHECEEEIQKLREKLTKQELLLQEKEVQLAQAVIEVQEGEQKAELKHASKVLALRDENILLKKQIVWLKNKLQPSNNPGNPAQKDQQSMTPTAKHLLQQLQDGQKKIDNDQIESGFNQTQQRPVHEEEIDSLVEKVRVLTDSLTFQKVESLKKLREEKEVHARDRQELLGEIEKLKTEVREEKEKRFTLERLSKGLTESAAQFSLTCEHCQKEPQLQPKDESHFLKLVDAIRQRKQKAGVSPAEHQTLARLEKVADKSSKRSFGGPT